MSTFWQVVRFVTTGSLATLVYLAFSYFLKSILGVHYLLTVVIAYVVGVAFNFTVQKYGRSKKRQYIGCICK